MMRWLLIPFIVGCSSQSSSTLVTITPVEAKQPRVEAQAKLPALFRDRTPNSGIDFTHRNGEEADHYTILETLGGGVAIFDFDRDGKLDLFFTGGGFFEGNPPQVRGYPGKLYQNLGDWKFRDVTASTLATNPEFYSHGASVADFNCDGWDDLLVTGYRRIVLYQNSPVEGEPVDSPKRIFKEVTKQVGLPESLPWSTSAAWGDLDGNGFPELFICQYLDWSFTQHATCPHHQFPKDVCSPHRFNALQPRLFQNDRGQFRDVSAEQSLSNKGKGLGVVISDLDADGRPDIYVANDASNNHLYLNRSSGKLEEVGFHSGVAVDESGNPNGSMGVTVGDWNRSGKASLFVTNFQDEWHALYTNLGKERFLQQSIAAGLGRIGQRWVGFGTAFVDVDGDGWLDLPIVNGHVFRHPFGSTLAQKPLLLLNREEKGSRLFLDHSESAGDYFRTPQRGRGLAVGDLDNDGWPDLVVSHVNQPVTILQNVAAESLGKGNRRITLQLRGKNHRSSIGATVELHTTDGKQLGFQVSGGYLSQSSDLISFGLNGAASLEKLVVHWPHGAKESFAVDKTAKPMIELKEGQGLNR